MAEDFCDFPHKESAPIVKAATEALASNKKTTLQGFDRLTCPIATDPYINRAEAYILLLDSVGEQIYLLSCPPKSHENHSDYITYGQGTSIFDRLGQHVTAVTQLIKDVLVKWNGLSASATTISKIFLGS